MTKSKFLGSGIFLLLVITIAFAVLAYQQGRFDKINKDDCQQLAMAFDENIDNFGGKCDGRTMGDNGPPLWVGGTIIKIENKGKFNNHSYFVLTFKGLNKTREIHLLTDSNITNYRADGNLAEYINNYRVGGFYKFNLPNICKTYYSAMYSGMFSDPVLTEFKSVKC